MNGSSKNFQKANTLFRKKDYKNALLIYKELAEKTPDFPYYKNWVRQCESRLNSSETVNPYSASSEKRIINCFFTIIILVQDLKIPITGTIRSALSQKYESFEVIVVESGNNEKIANELLPFGSSENIHFLKATTGGVASARNKALRNSKGDYVCYLDQGWILNFDFLRVMHEHIIEKKSDFIYAARSELIDGLSRINRPTRNKEEIFRLDKTELTGFCHSRAAYNLLGGFDENFEKECEKDFLLRYLNDSVVVIDNPLCIELIGSPRSSDKNWPALPASVYCEHLQPIVNWTLLENSPRILGKVSIIVLFISQPDMTINCINSVLQNSGNYEIELILVDNASEENCSKKVSQFASKYSNKIKYIRNNINHNFSLGNNIGVSHSTGEFIVFLNNDTIVTSEWLKPLISKISKEPEIGYVQPLLLYPDNTVQCSIVGFSSISPVPYHLYRDLESNNPIVSRGRSIRTATAACLSVRAKELISLRGFDPIFVNGCEDTDLCLRYGSTLGKLGFFEPASRVIHHESKSDGRMRYFYHNRIVLCRRWGGKTPIDDVLHYKSDGFFVEAYEPVERKDEKYPWIRRIDSPRLLPIDLINRIGVRVLVVKPSGVGNMMMFRDALQLLRETYKHAHFTILCYQPDSFVIRDLVDEVIAVDRKENGAVDEDNLTKVLAGKAFDIAIYPPFTSLWQPNEQLKRICTHHIVHPHVDFEHRHEKSHNLDLVAMLGADLANNSITPAGRPPGAEESRLKKVMIHVGASQSSHMRKKIWPTRYWADLIECVVNEFDVEIVGGTDDTMGTADVVALLTDSVKKRVTLSINKYKFNDLCNELRKSVCFISSDSGLMHVACGAGANVVSIFGPTNPIKNGPWVKNAIALLPTNIPCSPCYTAGPDRLNKCTDQICLKSIKPSDVFRAVLQFACEKH